LLKSIHPKSIHPKKKKEEEKMHRKDPIVSKSLSAPVFYLSFLILLTSVFAFYKRNYIIGAWTFAAFCTSLVHWSDPRYGYKRDLDKFVVTSGFLYLLWLALQKPLPSWPFWTCYILMTICYFAGWEVYNRGFEVFSMVLHAFVHLFGNAAVVLYCAKA
jgi:hypothetical protein